MSCAPENTDLFYGVVNRSIIRFYQKLTPELISLEERDSLYPEEPGVKRTRSFSRACYRILRIYAKLVVEESHEARRVDKRSFSASNRSMISAAVADFNPTFGLHPNMAEYSAHLIPA